MNVYITYYRYDRGEDFSLYHVDLTETGSESHWYEEDVIDFHSYGPDDVSQLYRSVIDLTPQEYCLLLWFMNSSKGYDPEFFKLMEKIHKESIELDSTYGGSCFEFIRHFLSSEDFNVEEYFSDGLPDDEDEVVDEVMSLLCSDDELFNRVLRSYFCC